MTHVITQGCCNDASCVAVCPVNCIHPAPGEPGFATAPMLFIDPAACIDCGACVAECPTEAISADFDLEPDQEPFMAVNEAYYLAPGRRDYAHEPVTAGGRDGARVEGLLRVAVVGAGPAGLYLADELLSRAGLDIHVDVFDRLPVPGGLVRYGVAPDHLGTKKVTSTFDRVLRHPKLRAFLNVRIGHDLDTAELADHYSAVVYAYGATATRTLGIPGEELPGCHPSADFVAWYNGHPDQAERVIDLRCHRAVVVGNGNVALDVARLLASHPDRLQGSDMSSRALATFADSAIREVVLLGRRGPLDAAFTLPEVIGLAATAGIDFAVAPAGVLDRQAPRDAHEEQLLAVLREMDERPDANDRRIVLRFHAVPEEITGEGGRVQGVIVRGTAPAEGTVAEAETIAAGLVVTAIGYRVETVESLGLLCVDTPSGRVLNQSGRAIAEDGQVSVGTYVTGWLRRGPSGVIGTNRHDAAEVAEAIVSDWRAGLIPSREDPFKVRDRVHVDVVDANAWRTINKHELDRGRAAGRPRLKILATHEMVAVARGSD